MYTKFWSVNMKGKRPLERPRRRLEENITVYHREIGICVCVCACARARRRVRAWTGFIIWLRRGTCGRLL
jgi:hypothetical protein